MKHMLTHVTGMYWEKARHVEDLMTLLPLKLNLWITINHRITQNPTCIWSKHFNNIYFFMNVFLWQNQAFLQWHVSLQSF